MEEESSLRHWHFLEEMNFKHFLLFLQHLKAAQLGHREMNPGGADGS